MLFQIPAVMLSPYANVHLDFLRQLQTGKIIVTLQFVPKSILFIIDVLVHRVILLCD